MNKLIFNYLAYNNQNQNELYFKMDKIINNNKGKTYIRGKC